MGGYLAGRQSGVAPTAERRVEHATTHTETRTIVPSSPRPQPRPQPPADDSDEPAPAPPDLPDVPDVPVPEPVGKATDDTKRMVPLP